MKQNAITPPERQSYEREERLWEDPENEYDSEGNLICEDDSEEDDVPWTVNGPNPGAYVLQIDSEGIISL